MASDKPMFGKGAYCAESSTKADQYAGTYLQIKYKRRVKLVAATESSLHSANSS